MLFRAFFGGSRVQGFRAKRREFRESADMDARWTKLSSCLGFAERNAKKLGRDSLPFDSSRWRVLLSCRWLPVCSTLLQSPTALFDV